MADSANRIGHNLEPGLRLDDRYELLCVLAQGGMANVWLARIQGKHGFEKLVAVKTILPHIAEDEQFKQMFLDEARVASHIEHPNVVQINDVGDHAGVSYLVMDLVEGESLQGILKACDKQGKRLPLGVAMRILADACLGLDAAHELRDSSGMLLNVVHRDISPQNILVTVSGTAKVIDFGIAKARDRATGDTSAGTLKGKINYMPTEQALGREVDRRTDTWALGATLYLLLTGRPPYKAENQLATLQLVMTAAEIPPVPEGVPSVIRAIVAKALSHDPRARYQTARELGMALEQAMTRLGLVTTSLQVAQLLHERIGDRLQQRREFIASALVEAANRERVRGMLLTAPNRPDGDGSGSLQQMQPVAIPSDLGSSSGISGPPAAQPPMPYAPPQYASEQSGQYPSAQQYPSAHYPAQYSAAQYPAPGADGMTAAIPLAHGALGGTTAPGTLGAATVEPPKKKQPALPPAMVVTIALLLCVAMAGGGVFLIFRSRSGLTATAAAAATTAPGPTIEAVEPKVEPKAEAKVDPPPVPVPPTIPPTPTSRPSASTVATAAPVTAVTTKPSTGKTGESGAAATTRPQPVVIPKPPKPVGAGPPKKHDDEAGF